MYACVHVRACQLVCRREVARNSQAAQAPNKRGRAARSSARCTATPKSSPAAADMRMQQGRWARVSSGGVGVRGARCGQWRRMSEYRREREGAGGSGSGQNVVRVRVEVAEQG